MMHHEYAETSPTSQSIEPMSGLQFGINVSTSAHPNADPVAKGRIAEDLGFDFLSSNDHPLGDQPSNEVWTQLSMIAASTDRIKIATRVLGVPFRNPVLLAKMAETLHRLSGNRLILGLGAGGMDTEIAAMGAAPIGAGAKVDGLTEAISVVSGMWQAPELTFEGSQHRTHQATITPRPAVKIPIWLGTYGPRALALTGRVADGWIPSLGYATASELREMRNDVVVAARTAGRPDRAVRCILNVAVDLASTESTTSVVGGEPDLVSEQLAPFIDFGFDGFNFVPPDDDWSEQTSRIAQSVVPALRGLR